MKLKGIILVFFMVIFLLPASAQDTVAIYQVNGISTDVSLDLDGSSDFSQTIDFTNNGGNSINSLSIQLPEFIANTTVQVDGQPAAVSLTHDGSNSLLIVTPASPISSDTQVIIVISADIQTDLQEVDPSIYQYFFDYDSNLISSNINFSVTLPLYSIVHQDGETNNIFPNNAVFASDGRRMTVEWLGLSNDGDVNTRLFVQFDNRPDSSIVSSVSEPSEDQLSEIWLPVSIFLILILLAGNIYLIHKHYYPFDSKNIEAEETVGDTDNREQNGQQTKIVRSVRPVILSPQELEILKIIAEHNGGIPQSDLVDLMNYSSARISQFLSKFEGMDIITKHKMGRQNYIALNMDLDMEGLQD